MSKANNTLAIILITSLFFFWGFIAASNGVFIPFCKSYFNIDQFQSQLVDFAFYGAYYFGALLLFIISNTRGSDIINKWGYKNSIIYGKNGKTNPWKIKKTALYLMKIGEFGGCGPTKLTRSPKILKYNQFVQVF